MYILDQIITFFGNLFGTTKYQPNKNKEEEVSIFDKFRSENGVNGKLDEAVYQGENGDCWVLSGALSMSYSKNGAQKFKDSISVKDDGSVDVTFEGLRKTFNITKKELDNNNIDVSSKTSKYSRGDDDALLLELAVEKAEKSEKNFSVKDGGNPYYLYKLYEADNIALPRTESSFKQALNYAQTNSDECAMAFGVTQNGTLGLQKGHSYAVKSVDNKNVTVVNPWDSTEEIKIDKNNFIKNQKNITMVYAQFKDKN